MSSSGKEDLQKVHGKRLSRLEPQLKEHNTLSRLQSLDLEVSEIKTSLLNLHDKVSTLTFMLDTFLKEMKGIVVEDVVVEEVDEGNAAEPQEEAVMEEVKEKAGEQEVVGEEKQEEKKEEEKEEEENPKAVDATQIQTIPPTIVEITSFGTKTSKKRKTRSRK